MANVTVKAIADFKHNYKGKTEFVKKGATLTIPPKLASVYERLDYVRLDSTAHAAVEKLESSISNSQSPEARQTPTKGKKP